MNSIQPSVFGRIFTPHRFVDINPQGLMITHKTKTTTLSWRDLTSPISYEYGVLGQTLRFNTESEQYRIWMRAYGSNRAFKAHTDTLWVKNNINVLNEILSEINQFAHTKFLRQSYVADIKKQVDEQYNRWLPWIKSSDALAAVSTQITLLEQYKQWEGALTRFFQHKYTQSQLKRYHDFFNYVETNPLTEQQRRACIIDDDNNLVLAGAGTGKTSVLVARAGYLVNSKQANYDDILLLAYGKQAASEMDERIKQKLGTQAIKTATFHSVGLTIISDVEGKAPKISTLAKNEQAKVKWVEGCFESLANTKPRYAQALVNYINNHLYAVKSEFEFSSAQAHTQYLKQHKVLSFKGERVHSFAELRIANWLCGHGISYQYKAPYRVSLTTPQGKSYKPCFYLPEHNIYLLYFSLDEQNSPPSYTDSQSYLSAIEWEKRVHSQHNTQCICLTYAQFKKSKLESVLKKQLATSPAMIAKLPDIALLKEIKSGGHLTTLATLFSQLISVYKTANTTLESESLAVKQAWKLLKPLLANYNHYLRTQGEIDFDDMIIKAIDYVTTAKFTSSWRYIMVDEFQDISPLRAALVKALRDSKPNSSLFAVGDDWQAIYRFSGADMRLTTEFAAHFGFTTQTLLDMTFRFNNKIGDVAAGFIMKNPAQLTKDIRSLAKVTKPAVSVLKTVNVGATKNTKITELNSGAVTHLLETINKNCNKPTTVYLLARFRFQLPAKADIDVLQQSFSALTIRCDTFHGSKGKEAEYVIILGMNGGPFGFPSIKSTPEILETLLPTKDSYAHSEERRLFYVALTRAKYKVYIISDDNNRSSFVDELTHEYELDLLDFKFKDIKSLTPA